MAIITVSPDGTKDYTTIQAGITAAGVNGEVIVYTGKYSEELTMLSGQTIRTEGYVELDGGSSLSVAITLTNSNFNLVGLEIKNYLSSAINSGVIGAGTATINKCKFNNSVNLFYTSSNSYFKNNIFNSIFIINQGFVEDNRFNSGIQYRGSYVSNSFRNNIVDGNLAFWTPTSGFMVYNNFTSTSLLRYSSSSSYITPTSIQDITDKYQADVGSILTSDKVAKSMFIDPTYLNEAKGNFILDYDDPLAFATFGGSAIGPYQAGLGWTMKTTGAGGDVSLYNVATDVYGLGLFAGITNVASINDASELIEATGVDTTNWGVFFLHAKSLPRAHIIKNIVQAFGDLNNRNDNEQVSINSNNSFQIDVLTAFSATQDATTLEADTSADFLIFRYRPNETNYYVDNAGTLVGDGDPGYLALVDSSDCGSGALPPIAVTAKSVMHIVIIRNVV